MLTVVTNATTNAKNASNRTDALAAISVTALDNSDVQRIVESAASIVGRALGAEGVFVQELREGTLVPRVPVRPDVIAGTHEIAALIGEWGEIAVYARRRFDDDDAAFLIAAADILRAAVERCGRDELVAETARQLRTPLAALLLKLQSIESMTLSARVSERLASALTLTKRLCVAVERVDDVARVAHRGVRVRPEDTDVAALIRNVTAEVSAQTGARVDVDGPRSIRGRFDRAIVAQVVRHLLSHGQRADVALHADGARVQVAVSGAEADEISVFVARAMIEAHGGKLSSSSSFELPRMFWVPHD